MGSLACEDSLKKKMMNSIDTVVGMFLILKHRGERAVLYLQNLLKLLYRLACGILGYSQKEICSKGFLKGP